MPSAPPLIEVLVRLRGESYARVELTKPRAVIGRDADADVRLDSTHVSRRHAELEIGHGEIVLVDRGSTNGIVVDGKRQTQVRLRPGETARIADFEITYRFLAQQQKPPRTEVSAGWEEYLDDEEPPHERWGQPDETRAAPEPPPPPKPVAIKAGRYIPEGSVLNELVERPAKEDAEPQDDDDYLYGDAAAPDLPLLLTLLSEEPAAVLKSGSPSEIAVEVIQTRGDTVLDVALLLPGQAYWWGGDPGAAALWTLPTIERFPMVFHDEPGRFRVQAPQHPKWRLSRRADSEAATYRSGPLVGCDAELGDQAEVSFGSNAFHVRCVRRPPDPPRDPLLRASLPSSWTSLALSVSILAHAVAVASPLIQMRRPLFVLEPPREESFLVTARQLARPVEAPPDVAAPASLPAQPEMIAVEPPPEQSVEPAPLALPKPRRSKRATNVSPGDPAPKSTVVEPPLRSTVSVADFRVGGMIGHLPNVQLDPSATRTERAFLRAEAAGSPGGSRGIVGKGGGGMEITPRGTLTAAEVSKVINQNARQIARCYNEALEVDSSSEGRVEMEWIVDIRGRVGGVRVVQDEVGSVTLVKCLRNVVRQWLFPSPRGGAAEVVFPFRFTNPRL